LQGLEADDENDGFNQWLTGVTSRPAR